jgi:tetratricopeptide (TPR) repeat protein
MITVDRARWTLAAVASASVIAALSLVQCSRSASAEATADCTCAGAPVVDATLLAFLSKARAAHHRADLHLEDGDLDLAIAALEPVVALPYPTAPEAIEVIADSRARLADLRSDLGAYEPALHDVEEGLALATKPTHFRGHLLEIKGVVLERRYHTLEATGEHEAADRAKTEALDAFRSAIEVQDQVIQEALPPTPITTSTPAPSAPALPSPATAAPTAAVRAPMASATSTPVTRATAASAPAMKAAKPLVPADRPAAASPSSQ